jgi:hypothetical protein
MNDEIANQTAGQRRRSEILSAMERTEWDAVEAPNAGYDLPTHYRATITKSVKKSDMLIVPLKRPSASKANSK